MLNLKLRDEFRREVGKQSHFEKSERYHCMG